MTKDNQDVTFRKLINKHFKDNPHLFIEQAFKNTCRNKSLSDDKLKVLKDELGKDIVLQVEKADRRKPILLVGSNDALVKGTLVLIWNTHPLIYDNKPKMGQSLLGYNNKDIERIFFLDKNCSGLSEEEIKRELFHKSELSDEEIEEHLRDHECIELIKPLIRVYKRSHAMLSLRGLESKQHENILKRIIVEVEERKSNFEGGFLVVGIDSTDHLPGQLVKEFEPMRLESGEQVKAVDTPKGNVFSCIGDMWKINLKDDHLQVKDTLYMKHIQYILKHPRKKFSLLELDKVFESKQQTNITKEQQKECMDILGFSNNLGKITKQDNENSKEYLKDKIKELDDEIEIAKDTGNEAKESELQNNRDEIVEILSSREYKTRIPNQRGKNEESILKGIKRCIESIKDASNKAKTGKLIAEHIDKNIERSKYHIVYSPEDSPNWNF